MLDVQGETVAGATFSVPIWHQFMEAAEEGLPARPFLTPPEPPVFKYFVHHSYGYLAIPQAPKTPKRPPKKVPLSPLEQAILAID
jgi:membrane carboxypeptidase/penicillin-binding protein